eukprot:TRINITY_DN43691_c0_g1_i1.p1 TRINITY_DN43691_c0_g1~~TRINITY_DN43691_c0_g1_i1.p1  ORF type:complete len:901 (-),score=76.27 TRINITY_DN43691_c0_g1_i1:448-2958(-)
MRKSSNQPSGPMSVTPATPSGAEVSISFGGQDEQEDYESDVDPVADMHSYTLGTPAQSEGGTTKKKKVARAGSARKGGKLTAGPARGRRASWMQSTASSSAKKSEEPAAEKAKPGLEVQVPPAGARRGSVKPPPGSPKGSPRNARRGSAAPKDDSGGLGVGGGAPTRRRSVAPDFAGGRGGNNLGVASGGGRRWSVMGSANDLISRNETKEDFTNPKYKEVMTQAIVIGVDWYADMKLPNCDHCCRDAEEVSKALAKLGYNVVLLHDNAAENLQPTKKNILHAIEKMKKGLKDGDPPILIYMTGRGGMAKLAKDGKGPEQFFLVGNDFDMRFIDDTTVLTVDELKGSKDSENVVIVDAYPFPVTRNVQSDAGFGIIESKHSIGGELQVYYAPKQCGAMTYWLHKALEGAAVREGRISSNTLNVYLHEKLNKKKVAVTTNASSLLVGNLSLTLHVNKTRQAMREEKSLMKVTGRRFTLNCIVPVEWSDPQHTTKSITQMMHKLNTVADKQYNKQKGSKRQGLLYRANSVTHWCYVIQGPMDIILRGDGRKAVEGALSDLYDGSGINPEYEVVPAGLVAPTAKDHVVLAVPTPKRPFLEKLRRMNEAGKFATLAGHKVVSCKLIVTLTLSGNLADYHKLNKYLRLGHWSKHFAVTTVTVDDPMYQYDHQFATMIQKRWRGVLGRRDLSAQSGLAREEEMNRKNILAAEAQARVHLGKFRVHGTLGVLEAEEEAVRRDKYDWEEEDRQLLYSKMRKLWERYEELSRLHLEDRVAFEWKEFHHRRLLDKRRAHQQHILSQLRRFVHQELNERQRIVLEERKERATMKNTRWVGGGGVGSR